MQALRELFFAVVLFLVLLNILLNLSEKKKGQRNGMKYMIS
jgi:hypothetical protein